MNPRFLGAPVLACLLALGLAGTASAHAELVVSDPPDGGVLAGTPATMSATFDEELDAAGSEILVRDAAGQEVARGGVSEEDPLLMTVELPEVPPGDYVALWTAVTPDDRGVTRGTISFTVEQPTATTSPTPSAVTPPPPTAAPETSTPTGGLSTPPSASPPPSPSPSPSPPPDDGEPTAGTTDVLLALVLAGAIVGGLLVYLVRR